MQYFQRKRDTEFKKLLRKLNTKCEDFIFVKTNQGSLNFILMQKNTPANHSKCFREATPKCFYF